MWWVLIAVVIGVFLFFLPIYVVYLIAWIHTEMMKRKLGNLKNLNVEEVENTLLEIVNDMKQIHASARELTDMFEANGEYVYLMIERGIAAQTLKVKDKAYSLYAQIKRK